MLHRLILPIAIGVLWSQLASAQKPSPSPNEVEQVRTSAEKGNVEAQAALGTMYEHGNGVAPDLAEAYKWFVLASERGSANAVQSLDTVKRKLTGEQRTEGLRRISEFHARKGSASQVSVPGETSSKLMDAPSRPEQVQETNEFNSSGSGDARALYAIGARYFEGQGVPQDYNEALKWFRKAAEQGVPEATFCIGQMYFLGQVVSKDPEAGMEWCRKAAEQGLPEAQCYIGLRYASGNEAPQDFSEALKWLRKAAEQEHADAQVAVGGMYANGRGVPKDQAEAGVWLRRAAEQGHAAAQASLSTACFSGDGVAKDVAEAYKWALLASARKSSLGERVVRLLERNSTKEQLEEGRKRAEAFQPRKKLTSSTSAFADNRATAEPSFSGGGFFITEDGYFISHENIGGEGVSVRIVSAGGVLPAKVVKLDKANNFSLLKADGQFVALPLASSRAARVGTAVTTVAYSGERREFSTKLVSGTIAWLTGTNTNDVRRFRIASSAPLSLFGGPLIDQSGNAIGVTTDKPEEASMLSNKDFSKENTSYAVKSSYLLSLLESLPQVAARLKEPHRETGQMVPGDVTRASVFILRE